MAGISITHEMLINDLRGDIMSLRSFSDEEIIKKMFFHRESLRLTFAGNQIMKKSYTCYEFDIQGTIITARHILDMSRQTTYPFYLSRAKLVLYSSKDAFMLRLSGEDIDIWLNQKK